MVLDVYKQTKMSHKLRESFIRVIKESVLVNSTGPLALDENLNIFKK